MSTQNDKMTSAIEAGYWISRDHGSWIVGHGRGSDSFVISRDHKNKAAARKAMIAENEADDAYARSEAAAVQVKARRERYGV